MTSTARSTLRQEADFTEDTVGLALESFLTLLTFPFYRFSIEPFSRQHERWLGADARMSGEHLEGFKPFYMQFKRPTAYNEASTAKVIVERKKLGLPVSPRTLFFGLREKQKTHWDYQHNILYRLRRRLRARHIGDAAYVCPLFLERSAYRFHVHLAGLRMWPKFWRPHPWHLREIPLHRADGSINFDSVPVLREHVTIPPHAKVADAKHSYSFTESGTDLCFHSPLALPEGIRSLADFLAQVTGRLDVDDGWIRPQEARQALNDCFAQPVDGDDAPLLLQDFPSDLSGIEGWMEWGAHLRQQHHIEQFALLRWAL